MPDGGRKRTMGLAVAYSVLAALAATALYHLLPGSWITLSTLTVILLIVVFVRMKRRV